MLKSKGVSKPVLHIKPTVGLGSVSLFTADCLTCYIREKSHGSAPLIIPVSPDIGPTCSIAGHWNWNTVVLNGLLINLSINGPQRAVGKLTIVYLTSNIRFCVKMTEVMLGATEHIMEISLIINVILL